MTAERSYDALILDLDGTVVDFDGQAHPSTVKAIKQAVRSGVRVMVATGRSEPAALPMLELLGLDGEASVYNGAAVYSPREKRLIREFNLSARVCNTVLEYAWARNYATVVMSEGMKRTLSPQTGAERLTLHDMHDLHVVSRREMRVQKTIRISLFSDQHSSSGAFAGEIKALLEDPVLLTHFPLDVLPNHHDSTLLMLDVHPDCRGKAEALAWLEEQHGIPPERVVAVGDAANDLTMLSDAGLGVCMEESVEEVRAVSDRVIGPCRSDTIAHLIEELFFQ